VNDSQILGIDTSNYKTSLCLYKGQGSERIEKSLFLPVAAGEKGLRQQDALFHHVKQLPLLSREVFGNMYQDITTVAVSSRPRSVPGSYMPCFLVGEGFGKFLADVTNANFYEFSHQEGHVAAAAYDSGNPELLDAPFLAWHLSGGTSELLYVTPDKRGGIIAQKIGGTMDISAGQAVDRAGVMLGLPFPSGAELDALAQGYSGEISPMKTHVKGLDFSLSGLQNQFEKLYKDGFKSEYVAAVTLFSVCSTVLEVTRRARSEYSGLPVLFTGGVSCNTMLRRTIEDGIFASNAASSDNAFGIAVLAKRREEANGK